MHDVKIYNACVAAVPVKDTTTEWITNWPATISQALTGEITAKECMDKLDKALNE